jgi:hypothetical protein
MSLVVLVEASTINAQSVVVIIIQGEIVPHQTKDGYTPNGNIIKILNHRIIYTIFGFLRII